jgi:hypothetical protein
MKVYTQNQNNGKPNKLKSLGAKKKPKSPNSIAKIVELLTLILKT